MNREAGTTVTFTPSAGDVALLAGRGAPVTGKSVHEQLAEAVGRALLELRVLEEIERRAAAKR